MRTVVVTLAIVSLVGCADRPTENAKRKAVTPDETFHNPVDNKTYVAPGGWKLHKPDVPRPDEPGKKVKTDQIRLLTSQNEIAARTTVKELAAFIKEAERLADESFGKAGKGFRLMVQFNCVPTGHKIKLALQGDAAPELLQNYQDGLTAAKKLSVKDGEVAFQLELSVNP